MGFWTFDLASGEASWTESTLAILHLTPGEAFPNEQLWQRIHPEDQELVQSTYRQMFDPDVTEAVEICHRILLDNGECRWIRFRGERLVETTAEDADRIVGVVQDVTAEVKAEQERKHLLRELQSERATLEARELQLQLALSGGGMGTWSNDLRNGRLCIDSRVATLFGLGPEELEFDAEDFQRFVHPDDRKTLLQIHERALEKNREYEAEFRALLPDGSVRWLASRGRYYRNREGMATRLAGVTFNIDERMRVVRELERARMEAEAANQCKSEFLANMSHEIRTPMTAILGFADLLASRISDEKHRRLVDTIRRNGQHLLEIINDILDLSRIEAGKMKVEHLPFSPTCLLMELKDLFHVRAEEKNLNFRLNLDPSLPQDVVSDPTRVRQIVMNLVGNAIKFTEKGFVEVTAAYTPEGGIPCLQIYVRDSGIGMTDEQLKALFQPFSQADTSCRRKYEGSGLGLAICKRLVGILGGSIRAESEWQEGSLFHVTIPAPPLSAIGAGATAPTTHLQK